MPKELMANGDDLGPVTLSIIDDLGFELYDWLYYALNWAFFNPQS
jgi:hypothetical protein